MARYSRVGMQELDQKLSRIVEAARVSPVSVFRYGAPWVWIVSQEEWQKTLTDIRDYLPLDHPLINLRDAMLESRLVERISTMTADRVFTLDTSTLVHLTVLRLATGHGGSDAALYQELNYNMLYRWFVGLDVNRRLWPQEDFVRDLRVFSGATHIMATIKTFVDEQDLQIASA